MYFKIDILELFELFYTILYTYLPLLTILMMTTAICLLIHAIFEDYPYEETYYTINVDEIFNQK